MELGHPQSGRERWRKSLLPCQEVCYKEAAWVYHWCQNTVWAPSSAPPASLQAPWAKTQNDESFCLLLLLFTPGLGMYTLWDSIISAHITFCNKWWIIEPVSIWEHMGVQWNRQEVLDETFYICSLPFLEWSEHILKSKHNTAADFVKG